MKRRNFLNMLIEIIIIISSTYGIIKLYNGLLTFSYFTILSNIFICIIEILFLIRNINFLLKKRTIKYDNSIYIAKFLATISVFFTFFVYLIILAPTNDVGVINSYLENGGGSLCLHIVTPLLAVIDFLYFDTEYISNKMHSVYAVIPPLIYALLIILLSELGVKWDNMLVPYNFLNYYSETGWFGFDLSLFSSETLGIGVVYSITILSIIFILVGMFFIWLRNKINRRL